VALELDHEHGVNALKINISRAKAGGCVGRQFEKGIPFVG
jgi:hypothetical protein